MNPSANYDTSHLVPRNSDESTAPSQEKKNLNLLPKNQPPSKNKKKKKKKAKDEEGSQNQGKDGSLWQGIKKNVENAWTKPIKTNATRAKTLAQAQATIPLNIQPQKTKSSQSKKKKPIENSNVDDLENAGNTDYKRYKIPKVHLEDISKLYRKLKKIQADSNGLNHAEAAKQEDERLAEWKLKHKNNKRRNKKLTNLRKSMRFVDDRIMKEAEAAKRRQVLDQLKLEALRKAADKANNDSEYQTVEEYDSKGKLTRKLDERTGLMKIATLEDLIPAYRHQKPTEKPSLLSQTSTSSVKKADELKRIDNTPVQTTESKGTNTTASTDQSKVALSSSLTKNNKEQVKGQKAESKARIREFQVSTYVEDHNVKEKTARPTHYYSLELRKWVDHIPSFDIDALVMKIINKLVVLEVQKKIKQPKKFRRRVVCGFREVEKCLDTKFYDRMGKCVIFALNIKENPYEYGTDEAVWKIMEICQRKGIPVIHSCTRKALGMAFRGYPGPKISAVSIINYHGAGTEELYAEMLTKVSQNRLEFNIRYT